MSDLIESLAESEALLRESIALIDGAIRDLEAAIDRLTDDGR